MITGVKVGYRYKMRLVYAHFPINASIVDNGKRIEVRNFVGQKKVFISDMIGETTVSMGEMRDEIYVEGIDLRDVSQSPPESPCLAESRRRISESFWTVFMS